MALDSGSAQALWQIYTVTGIRPEWLLPVLWHESQFSASASNGSYFGLGQNSAADITTFGGVDSATYLTWSASQQLSTVVKGYFSRYAGQLHSGIRVYQAEFLPGTLSTAVRLSDVIAASPSTYYTSNQSLDPNHDGVITLDDLGTVVAAAAATTQVQQAIATAYAGTFSWPTDPVYGYDFLLYAYRWPIAIGLVALSGGFVYATETGLIGKAKSKRRRRLR